MILLSHARRSPPAIQKGTHPPRSVGIRFACYRGFPGSRGPNGQETEWKSDKNGLGQVQPIEAIGLLRNPFTNFRAPQAGRPREHITRVYVFFCCRVPEECQYDHLHVGRCSRMASFFFFVRLNNFVSK